jgi:hypothetical protein
MSEDNNKKTVVVCGYHYDSIAALGMVSGADCRDIIKDHEYFVGDNKSCDGFFTSYEGYFTVSCGVCNAFIAEAKGCLGVFSVNKLEEGKQ